MAMKALIIQVTTIVVATAVAATTTTLLVQNIALSRCIAIERESFVVHNYTTSYPCV
jgi:hypothetical protein